LVRLLVIHRQCALNTDDPPASPSAVGIRDLVTERLDDSENALCEPSIHTIPASEGTMNSSNHRIDASNTAKVETDTKRERAPLGLRRDKVRVLRVQSGMKSGSSGFPTELVGP